MRRRFRPKDFYPPKAWRSRNRVGVSTDMASILKELYPNAGGVVPVRAAWAKDAYERHWMTWAEYRAVPIVRMEKARNPFEALYVSSPILGLVMKKRPPASVARTGYGKYTIALPTRPSRSRP